jgi:two-component system sensor kinase FixL
MLNLMLHGRHLAIGVAGVLTTLYAQQRQLKDFSSAADTAGINPPPLREHSLSGLTPVRHLPARLPCDDACVAGTRALAVDEPANSLPSWRRYVDAWTSWLHPARARSARRMLDVRTPLAQTLELMPVSIITVDQRDQIVFANARAAKLFGYTSDELVGASAGMLFPIHGSSAGNAPGDERGAARKSPGGATTQSLLARRRDGVSFSADTETTQCRVFDQVLRITAISACRTAAETDRNSRDLVHLARASSLGELAGSLAHELKQPLTAILFNAQAAKKFLDSDKANMAELREALEDIVADNCRANDVLQKIRALVRKGDIDLQLLDVGSVVRDIGSLVHSDALTRGVRTSFDIAENLALVCGDKVQLQQVVLNLLLNAFDALKDCDPADRIVETSVHEDTQGNVRITVKDRGQGLTVDNLEKIFRPFFTTKPQGLGLGLSISRTIVTAHQGRLWAENNHGKGASFHVTLPRARSLRQSSQPEAS